MKTLVYSSIGDISSHFKYWKDERLQFAFNYYGDSPARAERIKESCQYFTQIKGTKFNLFSKLYPELPEFDYYALLDDDLDLTGGEIAYMAESMRATGYGVGSPAHSPQGRISWSIMCPRPDSQQRDTPFVEMTAVIFSRAELEKFLTAYVPYRDRMVGWGVDHIIHSVCRKPFVIFDEVRTVNPTNEQKNISEREIDTYLAGRSGKHMWKAVLAAAGGQFREFNGGA